ncbi:MAG TPA: amidohydrolase family protein [Thermomicrobiales bacterium]|nr:amidohydrolase family protein [Thermomicrobiales bacterium]
MLITAGRALPLDGRPPIADAAVLTAGSRIVAVGPRREVLARPDAAGQERRDFGAGAVLLPGLVNAHIHLEYTHLGPLAAPTPFFPWLRGLSAWSGARAEADWGDSAAAGADACLRGGVTCLGEIVTRGEGLAAMAARGLHGVAYVELFGARGADYAPRLARFDERVAAARAAVAAAGDPALRVGLSPHTPYTLSGAAITAVAARAHDAGAPLAIHVAESPGEVELLAAGAGPIADWLVTSGGDAPLEPYRAGGYGQSPLAYVAARGVFRPGHPTLVVHAVQMDDADVAALARHGAAVALCPRSNDFLCCGEAPVAALLRAGIPLGVGTDSLGSNRDLDLFNELRALAAIVRRQAERAGRAVDEAALARRLLALATAEGARALALDAELGTLAPGKLADLAVLAFDGDDADPYRAILDRATAADVRCTILGGRVVHAAAGAVA